MNVHEEVPMKNVHESGYRPRPPAIVRTVIRDAVGTCLLCGMPDARVSTSKSGRSLNLTCTACGLKWTVTIHQLKKAMTTFAELHPDDVRAQRLARHEGLLIAPVERRRRTAP